MVKPPGDAGTAPAPSCGAGQALRAVETGAMRARAQSPFLVQGGIRRTNIGCLLLSQRARGPSASGDRADTRGPGERQGRLVRARESDSESCKNAAARHKALSYLAFLPFQLVR